MYECECTYIHTYIHTYSVRLTCCHSHQEISLLGHRLQLHAVRPGISCASCSCAIHTYIHTYIYCFYNQIPVHINNICMYCMYVFRHTCIYQYILLTYIIHTYIPTQDFVYIHTYIHILKILLA